ncbi:MAG: HrpE/YscL family type III secretion apparatus protein [Desulfovibrionaceae bacterium]
MDRMFFLTHSQIGIAAGVKVIKAKEYATFLNGVETLHKAKEEGYGIIKQAEEEYERMRELGYRAGIDEGKMEMAERIMEQITSSVDYFADVENTVVDVVIAAITKIIGEMDDKERVSAIVHRSLSYVRNQKKVLVRLSPEDVPYIQENLNDIIRNYPGINFLDVAPDPKLARGDCILESEMGIVNAGLNTQIEAIKRSFSKRLQKKNPPAAAKKIDM